MFARELRSKDSLTGQLTIETISIKTSAIECKEDTARVSGDQEAVMNSLLAIAFSHCRSRYCMITRLRLTFRNWIRSWHTQVAMRRSHFASLLSPRWESEHTVPVATCNRESHDMIPRAHYEDLIRKRQKLGKSGTCYAGGFPFALLPEIHDFEESSSAIRKYIHFGPFRCDQSFILLGHTHSERLPGMTSAARLAFLFEIVLSTRPA